MRSLRRTLVVALVTAVAAATAAGALATYRVARHELDAIFDYHLRQIALSIRDEALGLAGAPPRGGPDVEFVVQVFDPRGRPLYASSTSDELPPALRDLGFATVERGRARWRVYALPLGVDVLQVAQPLDVRAELAFAAASRTLLPLLVLVPLLAVLAWWVVGRALAPLDRMARAASARGAASLEPFAEAGVPDEVLPLVASLNDLLARLGASLASQRAFVADAAHELRTPLAALKVQAQLASRAAQPAERAAAMQELEAGIERAAHVVAQLLTLARAEPDARTPQEPQVDLVALVEQSVADHAALAASKQIDLGATRLDPAAASRGDPTALRTLVGNLLDNAIRYTPAGGRVDVATGTQDGRAWLEVTDTGPGIPPEERERVFDRFYRRPGSAPGGSGLGLAIVRAIARRHGAEVTLDGAPVGGLRARVRFPVAETPPGSTGFSVP